jgi:hypothetical protein
MAGKLVPGEDDRHLSVREDKSQALLGVEWIKRNVGAAGFYYPQYANDLLKRTFHTEPDQSFWSYCSLA